MIGAGVFGALAADALRARGHDPRVVSRREGGVDARDEASVARALAGHDAVLHAAGPYHKQPPGAAQAAARAGLPYADLSDDRGFSARVRALASDAPLLTGMSTTPAVADALAALVLRRSPRVRHVAMYVGGSNRAGPATMRFAAASRLPGRPIVVEVPGLGRRRAHPAAAHAAAPFYVAVGGLAGLGWRLRPLARLAAPLAARLPRFGRDTAGALVAEGDGAREALHAPEGGQRLAVLPAVWAIEEALAGRAPRGPALPSEWVDAEALVAFLVASGFRRTSA